MWIYRGSVQPVTVNYPEPHPCTGLTPVFPGRKCGVDRVGSDQECRLLVGGPACMSWAQV